MDLRVLAGAAVDLSTLAHAVDENTAALRASGRTAVWMCRSS